MNIDFTQFYIEPGASFNISGKSLERLCNELNQLGIEIPALRDRFKTDNYTLMLIISAKKNLDKPDVKGPKIRLAHKEAEFALYLPWISCGGFAQEITHVYRNIADAINLLLEKYNILAAEVSAAVDKAIKDITNEPEKYQNKWNKSGS